MISLDFYDNTIKFTGRRGLIVYKINLHCVNWNFMCNRGLDCKLNVKETD